MRWMYTSGCDSRQRRCTKSAGAETGFCGPQLFDVEAQHGAACRIIIHVARRAEAAVQALFTTILYIH
jgi:hypothetical protein